MKRSDVYGLCAVIMAAPHIPAWGAVLCVAWWLYRAIKLEGKGE